MKRILILTAGFGEGHNSAARGIRDALARIAPADAQVEMHDLFAETYGVANDIARSSYLALINHAPRAWSKVFNWVDRQKNHSASTKPLFMAKNRLARMLARFRPDAIVSVYPAYGYMLDEILGPSGSSWSKRIVIVTDSITINSIWYRCSADYFLVPNEVTAKVLREAGIASEIIKAPGFPVNPKFADPVSPREAPSDTSGRRVLYMISAGKAVAPQLVERLAQIPDIQLTVTVGRDARLQATVENIRNAAARPFEIVGWSEELPQILRASHVLVSKAGGATVQETIAASCPMIINQIVPGQEEGNARLILETKSGTIAESPELVVEAVQEAFANGASQWNEWHGNISKLSRPAASLEIAQLLLSL